MSETTDRTDTIKKQFPELLFNAAGFRTAACKSAGIARQTFYEWYKEDLEFKKAIDDVDEQLIDLAESQLLINIKKGKELSLIFFLKNKAPQRWRDVHAVELVPPEQRIREIIEGLKNDKRLPENSVRLIQGRNGETIPPDEGTK